MDDSILYMYGGTDIYGEKNDLWEFNLKQARWNNTKNFIEVSSRISASITFGIYKNFQAIIIIGGKDLNVQYFDVVM
jgi:hypothetical protein